jgi:hypothetical protein
MKKYLNVAISKNTLKIISEKRLRKTDVESIPHN